MLTQFHLSCLPQEPIRPLEKRALNFLVNEYLLKNEYKLSSITFSDENDDQVNFSLYLQRPDLLLASFSFTLTSQLNFKTIYHIN